MEFKFAMNLILCIIWLSEYDLFEYHDRNGYNPSRLLQYRILRNSSQGHIINIKIFFVDYFSKHGFLLRSLINFPH